MLAEQSTSKWYVLSLLLTLSLLILKIRTSTTHIEIKMQTDFISCWAVCLCAIGLKESKWSPKRKMFRHLQCWMLHTCVFVSVFDLATAQPEQSSSTKEWLQEPNLQASFLYSNHIDAPREEGSTIEVILYLLISGMLSGCASSVFLSVTTSALGWHAYSVMW